MQSLLDFVPRRARVQFRHFRIKQRAVLLGYRTATDSADYKADPLAPARGVFNAVVLAACIYVAVGVACWLIVEFGR